MIDFIREHLAIPIFMGAGAETQKEANDKFDAFVGGSGTQKALKLTTRNR